MYARRTIIFLGLLLALTGTHRAVSAADGFDPAARAKAIAPYIDARTIAVLRIDLARIEVDQLFDKFVELVPEADYEVERSRAAVAGCHAALVKAGFVEVYMVFSLADLPRQPPFFILPVNGLVMAQDADLFDAVDVLIAEGYISIKIKVGRQPLAKDIETIQRLKELIGNRATIRLDANRLWTLDESLEFCNQVAGDQIEYIEEPLADMSQYPFFFDSTDMPVAFDETLVEKGVEELDCLDKVKAFILKPSLLGGLSSTGQFIDIAYENKILPVISCTFPSDLSLRSFALFAAMFGITDIPLGLDTMKWFAQSLLKEGFKVTAGHIDVATLVNRPVFNEQLLHELR